MKRKSRLVLHLLLLIVTCHAGSSTPAAVTNDVVEVPFDFYHDTIIVRAKVNGKGPFDMFLDTGVDPSVINLETARKIGLKFNPVGRKGTGGGTDANLAHETRLPLLELGSLKAEKVAALATDLTGICTHLGRPIQGVLGYSLLKDRVVQINYPKHVVCFYPVSPFPENAEASGGPRRTFLPFRYRDEILMDKVTVNGKNVVANLDTGSNGAWQLTPAAVAKLGLETEALKSRISQSAGFNGDTTNHKGKIKNITIGDISVDGPTVVFYGKGTGRDHEDWGIRIGNAFLKGYVVTIDYQSNVITLERP